MHASSFNAQHHSLPRLARNLAKQSPASPEPGQDGQAPTLSPLEAVAIGASVILATLLLLAPRAS